MKTQFDPERIEENIRKLIVTVRNNTDEGVKQKLMPIVRDLIETVVIGKRPGHQPSSLHVRGSIATIMASIEVLDLMTRQVVFVAAAHNDLLAKIASRRIDTEQKRQELLGAYAEELIVSFPAFEKNRTANG